MPTDFVHGETVHANLPDGEDRYSWEVIPGGFRIRGRYRRGQKASGYVPLYLGPFADANLWRRTMSEESLRELGGLMAQTRSDAILEGVISDWLEDYSFPDWMGPFGERPYRSAEWRLMPIWTDDFAEFDKTFRVGDSVPVRCCGMGVAVSFGADSVKASWIGPRGGRHVTNIHPLDFSKDNK